MIHGGLYKLKTPTANKEYIWLSEKHVEQHAKVLKEEKHAEHAHDVAKELLVKIFF